MNVLLRVVWSTDAATLCLCSDVPYLAIQDRLWGADAFFYGDYESMRMICQELAPRYYEYTSHLGHASSEPMLYEVSVATALSLLTAA